MDGNEKEQMWGEVVGDVCRVRDVHFCFKRYSHYYTETLTNIGVILTN